MIDVVPTVLEAAQLPEPAVVNGVTQHPIEGISMAYSFDNAKAAERRKTQYFEIFGNLGVYHDGWFASTTPQRLHWSGVGIDMDVLTTKWELYNIDKDFSQADDLAAQMPDKLREMQVRFYAEAAKHNVLPIDNSRVERMDVSLRPSPTRGRSVFTYYAGQTRIPEGSAPDIKNKSFKIAADIEVPPGGADGVVITQGGRFGGWALCLFDGKQWWTLKSDHVSDGRHG